MSLSSSSKSLSSSSKSLSKSSFTSVSARFKGSARRNGFAAVALLLVVPGAPGRPTQGTGRPPSTPMSTVTRDFVSTRCTAAALAVADPAKSGLEVRAKGRSAPTTLTSVRITDWYFGHTPGRYIASMAARAEGGDVEVRATVNVRTTPCTLVTWRIVR